ncbi:MAG: LysR family transcriptional regulator, partial [Pseudomonadota bacterium]
NIFHMNAIEWRHYQIVLAIQNTGSLTAAARSVNVTQSAATHQVKEAERRLGIDLVERHGRTLKLTPAGLAIAEAASACAPLLQRAESRARELSHTGRMRLRIAFGVQDGLDWVPPVSLLLSQEPVAIQLDLVDGGRRPPSQSVRQGEAEMALEIGEAGFPDLVRFEVGYDELVCLLAVDHALKDAPAIGPDEIQTETYFAHSLVPQPGFELEAFFQPAGAHPGHVAQIESLQAILRLVSAGLGVSIQPQSAAASAVAREQLAAVPLSGGPIRQPWYLHVRPNTAAALGEAALVKVADEISSALCLVPARGKA